MTMSHTLGAFVLSALAAATVASLTLIVAAATIGVALHAAGATMIV